MRKHKNNNIECIWSVDARIVCRYEYLSPRAMFFFCAMQPMQYEHEIITVFAVWFGILCEYRFDVSSNKFNIVIFVFSQLLYHNKRIY